MHMTSGNRAELSPLTNSAVKYEKKLVSDAADRRADKLCKAGVGSCCHARVALAAQRPAAYNTHEYATVACIGWSCYWHEVHITYLLQTGSKHDVIKVSALSRTAKIMSDVFVQ